jgi:hypothetical protein
MRAAQQPAVPLASAVAPLGVLADQPFGVVQPSAVVPWVAEVAQLEVLPWVAVQQLAVQQLAVPLASGAVL